MAKPSVKHGFLMVPLDLLPAVMTADFTNAEMIVLAEALLQRYGVDRRERVVLDWPTIESGTGLSCKNARRAVKSLVAARVLVASGGSAYLVNDDYETWTPGGQAFTERLGGGLLRFCFGALARFGKREKTQEDVGVQVDSHATSVVSPTGLSSDARNPSTWTPTTVDASVNGAVATPSANGHCDASLASGRAPASEELDSEQTHTHTSRTPETPALRTAEDQAKVEEAIGILAADLQTEALGMKLSREHNGPALREVEGWRWVHAAYTVQGPDIPASARASLKYLTRCAVNVAEADALTARPKPGASKGGDRRRATERPAPQPEFVTAPPDWLARRRAHGKGE